MNVLDGYSETLLHHSITFYFASPCCLSGSMPNELGELGALTILHLDDNMLKGEREASEVLRG